ncbi:hypothetical protein NP493_92g05021 [Ridgeia piscesae]|uniref:Telomerase RNA component interacting RNase n=1 Tax=Ridgeia piscesae TaxID=27915 RepID=A0AAD9P886_RIDPI|nr:hypothetical protein NP493_92g05021 [Ridgeia piscesae]
MEMFKKQMEEKQRQNDSEKRQHAKESTGSATSSNESHATGTEKLQASSSSEGTDKRTIKPEKKNYSFFVGKRRGNAPVLKTGAVKKARVQEKDEGAVKTDAWSRYLAEVQKYKSRSCQDEDRTRPLVK